MPRCLVGKVLWNLWNPWQFCCLNPWSGRIHTGIGNGMLWIKLSRPVSYGWGYLFQILSLSLLFSLYNAYRYSMADKNLPCLNTNGMVWQSHWCKCYLSHRSSSKTGGWPCLGILAALGLLLLIAGAFCTASPFALTPTLGASRGFSVYANPARGFQNSALPLIVPHQNCLRFSSLFILPLPLGFRNENMLCSHKIWHIILVCSVVN